MKYDQKGKRVILEGEVALPDMHFTSDANVSITGDLPVTLAGRRVGRILEASPGENGRLKIKIEVNDDIDLGSLSVLGKSISFDEPVE